MKTRFSSVISILAILAAAAASNAAPANSGAPATGNAAATTQSAPATSDGTAAKSAKNPNGWPVLKKGMPEEDIVRAIGKPDAVKPMETPEGKAEVGIYRRLANSVTRQSAVTTESVAAFNGLGLGNESSVSVKVPSYRLERVNVYQVSSILVFEGRLVTATQKVEQESHFE